MTQEEFNDKFGEGEDWKIAIHESSESVNIVKYIPLCKFTDEIIALYDAGLPCNAYYENGEIVVDEAGCIHKNVINE